MYLSKIKYQKENQAKIMVVLILGKKDDKLVCILDSAINENATSLIKRNVGKLNGYTIHNKIGWFKDNLPSIYKKGYREIYLDRVKLLESYPIE